MKTTPRSRPSGVSLLSIVSAIGGVLALRDGVEGIGLGSLDASAGLGGMAITAGVLAFAYAVLALSFAYGAWTIQPWAWLLGVAAQLLALVTVVLAALAGSSIPGPIITALIAVAILYYLNTPAVKGAFGRS